MAADITTSDMLKMGLLEKRQSISIKTVRLRVPTSGQNRRAQILQQFQTDNTGNNDVVGVEWAVDNAPTTN